MSDFRRAASTPRKKRNHESETVGVTAYTSQARLPHILHQVGMSLNAKCQTQDTVQQVMCINTIGLQSAKFAVISSLSRAWTATARTMVPTCYGIDISRFEQKV